MDPALQLHPSQERLTPEQEAEAERFADERIQAQLSTEPVDVQEAEVWLRQAYAVAGLAPPTRILWLDGPLQLVAVLAPQSLWDCLGANVGASLRGHIRAGLRDTVGDRIWDSIRVSLNTSVGDRVSDSLWASVWDFVGARVRDHVGVSVGDRLSDSLRTSVGDRVSDSLGASVWRRVRPSLENSMWASVRAYHDAAWLAFASFFDAYLASHDLVSPAHFIDLVSGYWLSQEVALLVRRPKVLSLDAVDRLHSTSTTCLAYHDGWGFFAWHGVLVPEQVILAPERLSREDFLNARNVEVRRIIQERMGSRFVAELGGIVIDTYPRGTLYEVRLPEDDPEGVARYVQLQNASTDRSYSLRVPPTIQSAAEAVAWSFGLSVEEYHPAQET